MSQPMPEGRKKQKNPKSKSRNRKNRKNEIANFRILHKEKRKKSIRSNRDASIGFLGE